DPARTELASTEVPADSGGSTGPIATGEPRPSFDCARAATVVENMLCSDAGLADRDRRMADQYKALRGALPDGVRSQLLQSQRLFLRQRSDCRSSQCLADLYDVRLRQLAEFASN
ncbi:MAG: lysozyme inhibitor LprI family protein, partial [Sphingomicrobium sp.]